MKQLAIRLIITGVLLFGTVFLLQCSDQPMNNILKSEWSYAHPVQTDSPKLPEVSEGDQVMISYSVHPPTQMDYVLTKDRKLQFTVGEEHYLREFDKVIRRMQVGDKAQIRLSGDKIFGSRSENLVIPFSKEALPEGTTIEKDRVVWFRAPDGKMSPHRIVGLKDDHVLLDMNHPYAEETVIVQVQLLDILS